MLATVGGSLALLLGLALLLLPLLATELSRPRDSAWGAVVLLLGLVLVTSADRLTGAPMLAVLCGGLLIGRLSSEVGQTRWRQLSDDERQRLASSERWSRSAQQLATSCSNLLSQTLGLVGGLAARVSSRTQRPGNAKRWVRPELPQPTSSQEPQDSTRPEEPASRAGEPSPQGPPSQRPAGADSSGLAPGAGTQQPASPASETPSGARASESPKTPAPGFPAADGVSETSASKGARAAAHGLQGDGSPAELPNAAADPDAAGAPGARAAAAGIPEAQQARVVRDFSEITALLAAAPAPEAEPSQAG
ncbi:MAG: Ycf66 family protein [Cyanobium sp.]